MEQREIPLDPTKPIKLTSMWFDTAKGNTYLPGVYQPNAIPVKAWSSKNAVLLETNVPDVPTISTDETIVEIETKPSDPTVPTLDPVPSRDIKHTRSKIKE